MSRLYAFVRARQLEGTFPGTPGTGTWPISAMRIMYGWGYVPEEAWPYAAGLPWPPSTEPIGIDALAKERRLGWYHRVRTPQECKAVLASRGPVLASFDITEQWFSTTSGRIALPLPSDVPAGGHTVLLVGYDDNKAEFKFLNSWGTDWGDNGYGYIPYKVFETIWNEGWWSSLNNHPAPPQDLGYRKYTWGLKGHYGGVLHCCELATPDDERIGWFFALLRDGSIEVEELFVRPQFRGEGNGKRLLNEIRKLASTLQAPVRIWISFADADPRNLQIIRKLVAPLGLSLKPSGVRWAALVASAGGEGLTVEELQNASKPGARPRAPFRPAIGAP